MLFKAKPKLVAALQSPHLLNIWSTSNGWELTYDLLGDHDGFEEAKDIKVDKYTGRVDKVAGVLVTTPSQLENAKKKYINAKVFWVVHSGSIPHLLPDEHTKSIDGVLTTWYSIIDTLEEEKGSLLDNKEKFVITPWYEASPTWSWKPNLLWTIRSRLTTRHHASKDLLTYVMSELSQSLSKDELRHYGQDAPFGYIDELSKKHLYSQCSGYISALPVKAGFGLAEHEAFASGVPVVGSKWGDLAALNIDFPTLKETPEEMVESAVKLATNKSFAESASKAGLEYINTYRRKDIMDKQIKDFLSSL